MVRHGQAEYGADHDANRNLTPLGQQEALAAAKWLEQASLDRPLRIIASPYLRAQQTAHILSEILGQEVETSDLLTPDQRPHSIVGSLFDNQKDLILVAHQPLVGRLASLVTQANDAPLNWATAECRMMEGELIAAGCMTELVSWYPTRSG